MHMTSPHFTFPTFSACMRMLSRCFVCVLLATQMPAVMAQAMGSFATYFRAVQLDNANTVKSLLARGFDPNAVEEKRGESGLMLAIRESATHVFEELLKHPEIDVNARAFNGDTALMIASFMGNGHAVGDLIANGATVQHDGWAPVHYAAMGGHDGILGTLLKHGGQINARSENGTTPVMMAAWGGKIYTVKYLIDRGADIALQNTHGMGAIDFARNMGYKDIAEGLEWQLKRAGRK